MDNGQKQAIDEAVAKYDLPNDGVDMKLLLLACARERDFERFYRHAVKLVSDEKLRKSLAVFARDEEAHQVQIQEVYDYIRGSLDLPDQMVDLLGKCPWDGFVVQPGIAPGEVLDMAIKLEKDAQLFFEAQMAESQEPEVEEVLEYLAVLEEEHYIKLKAMRGDVA